MHDGALCRAGRRVGLLACLLLPLVCAADDAAQQAREAALKTLERWVQRDFKLPPQLMLDATLRREAETIAAEHRARLLALTAAWADDELPRVDLGASPHALVAPLVARYLNELALWQLDTTGDDYDRIMLRSLQDPGLCLAQQDQQAFAAVLAAAQRMAPADRALVLAAQRLLLARWGQQRAVPERPLMSLQERAVAALRAMRGINRPAHEPPPPPALAWSQLRTPPRKTDATIVCAMVRWELQRAPALAAPPAEQMLLARYALVFDAGAALRDSAEPELGGEGYPGVAARFGVEGDVTVQGRKRVDLPGLDAARVVARNITVPGIRGVRPVAFETVLDSASLARATKLAPAQQAPTEDSQVNYRWKLE